MSDIVAQKVDKAVEAVGEASKEILREVALRLAARLGVDLTVRTVAPPAMCPTEPAQTEFDVILAATGPKKIEVIKAVRQLTGLGLKEAKDLVETLNTRIVKAQVGPIEAKKAKEQLEAAGATVVLR